MTWPEMSRASSVGYLDWNLSRCEVYLPFLPDLPHKIRPWLQRGLPWTPTRGRCLGSACPANQLKGLKLSNKLIHVAPHRRGEDLDCLNNPIRIYYETPPRVYPSHLIITSIGLPNLSCRVSHHSEWEAPLDHLREFLLLPDLVHELAVHAHGYYRCA